MALTSIALIFILSHLIQLFLALGHGAKTSCPSSFECAGVADKLGYPFTSSVNPRCGVILLDCDNNAIRFTRTGPWYEISYYFSSTRSLVVGDPHLYRLSSLKCDTIEHVGFTLPEPSSSFEIRIVTNETVWNCSKTIDIIRGYNDGTLERVTDCIRQNVYKKSDANYTVDFITGCEVVNYPTNLIVELSDKCSRCVSEHGTCHDLQNGGFRCIKRKGYLVRRLLPVLGASIGMIVILIGLVVFTKRKIILFGKHTVPWTTEVEENKNLEAFLNIYGSLAPTRYTCSEIRLMTNAFKHKLGEGGYGTVYKGELLDGRLVAVKKLKNLKGNGEEFINEVVSISRTNHVNVVSLIGFCIEGDERALVYEFMPNGSLEKYICREGSALRLAHETMLFIAVGVAKGLDYLHKGCNARILHFDIKPHNILLDQEFCPKISDFGLAKLSETKNSMISMLEARGTIGYIAPEVFCRNFGGVSHKSDVYSYGMMVLDIACGRKNLVSQIQNTEASREQYFPDWIYNQLEHKDEVGIHFIVYHGERDVLRKMILVGLWCIQTYPSNRPSMSRVIEMLEGEAELIEMPPKPVLGSPPRS